MKTKLLYIFLLLIVLISSISCDGCYFGSSESTETSQIFSFNLDFNGNANGQAFLATVPVRYSYFNNDASYSSDLSLLKKFNGDSYIMNVDFFNHSGSMFGGYVKAGFYKTEDDENWNLLSRNFKATSFDIIDTRSPYTTAYRLSQERTQRIENPYLIDSTYHSVYKPHIIRYTHSNANDTVKTFRSGFDSATSYRDSLVLDIKMEDEHSLIILLLVTEYKTEDEASVIRKRYRRISDSLVFARLNSDMSYTVLHSQSNEGIYITAQLTITEDYYLIENYSGFIVLDKNFGVVDSKVGLYDKFNAFPSTKGKSIIYNSHNYNANSNILYMHKSDGSFQKLSELLPVSDYALNFAIVYDDRYVVYISENSTRISQFDLQLNQQRFSIPINSTYFKHPKGLISNKILPLIFMSDEKINLFIEFNNPPVDDGC